MEPLEWEAALFPLFPCLWASLCNSGCSQEGAVLTTLPPGPPLCKAAIYRVAHEQRPLGSLPGTAGRGQLCSKSAGNQEADEDPAICPDWCSKHTCGLTHPHFGLLFVICHLTTSHPCGSCGWPRLCSPGPAYVAGEFPGVTRVLSLSPVVILST